MESELTKAFGELENSPASFIKLSRRIDREFFCLLQPLNAAFLATFNIETAAPFLLVESARRGFHLRPWFAPFGQLEQQVLDPDSHLYSLAPDVIVVATQFEDVAPDVAERFATLGGDDIMRITDEVVARLESLTKQIRQRTGAAILISNFSPPRFPAYGITTACISPSQADVVAAINRGLALVVSGSTDVFIVDLERLVSTVGIRNWYDDKLASLARVPFGFGAQIAFSRLISKWFRALQRPPCKCLVVDFDNTIWGGVIGEDGLGGIRLGADPPGNAFVWFQKYLLGLKDRGVLLAGASKNNEAEALEVLNDHPDCVLSVDDFSALEIHWDDKATSIKKISETLGIGLEAIAFFDDNPVEREWVRNQIPEVTVIEVPKNPIAYRQSIEDSDAFDAARVSAEDLGRSRMVAQDTMRRSLSTQSTSLDQFLRDLKMEITIGAVTSDSLPRVTQLVAKTNQFNLTTRRHPASTIRSMIDSGGLALWLRLSDRFGDQGLVGVAIVLPVSERPATWKIDTFLLSCRVLSRQVESAFLSELALRVKERDGRTLIGEYFPTGRNEITADFYKHHGFQPGIEGSNSWLFDLAINSIPFPDLFSIGRPS